MMLLLLKVFGVQRVAGWALRLIKAIVWLGLVTGFALVLVLVLGRGHAGLKLFWYFAICLTILGARALWLRHRKSEPTLEVSERTIDGKVVPDKLAVAAFGVPQRSASAEAVLRGLPDYGKTLLGLVGSQFEFMPELALNMPLYLPVEQPDEDREEGNYLPWAIAVAVVVLVVVGVTVVSAGHDRTAERIAAQAMGEQPDQLGKEGVNTATQLTPTVNLNEAENASSPASSSPETPQESDNRFAKLPASRGNGAGASRPAEDPAGTWRDASTGLLWPQQDNGPEPIRTFDESERYCKTVEAGGITGWRLPTLQELDAFTDAKGRGLPGGLQRRQPAEIFWTSTLDSDGIHHVSFVFGKISPEAEAHDFTHDLCVHN